MSAKVIATNTAKKRVRVRVPTNIFRKPVRPSDFS
jgi:hypothetical protein